MTLSHESEARGSNRYNSFYSGNVTAMSFTDCTETDRLAASTIWFTLMYYIRGYFNAQERENMAKGL
ncbi:hypothetical protein BC830DRAFT_1155225 [Chytriomyces sp. MP71]|nr:hypothetical protein BC830DRAFT_1155225 [Chytriomyces sp. MP71]